MSSKLLSTADLESDTAMGKVEKPLKQPKKKGKKEKPKATKVEDAVEKQEIISPKAKKVKRK